MKGLMKTNGGRAPKKFNPEAFKTDMMRLPPHEAADVTLKWRERAMNAAEEMAEATNTAFKMLSGGIFVLAAGMLEGRQKAQAEQLVEDWEAGGAAEAERDIEEYPTPWSAGEMRNPALFLGFMPITLALTALPAIFGIFDTGAAPYLREAAKAGTYFFVGELGIMAGNAVRKKRLAQATDEDEEDEAA